MHACTQRCGCTLQPFVVNVLYIFGGVLLALGVESCRCKCGCPGLQMEFNAPTRTTKYPREVPPLPWYRHTLPQMLMAGFLPFSAIYIELYYIFASVWGEQAIAILSVFHPLMSATALAVLPLAH